MLYKLTKRYYCIIIAELLTDRQYTDSIRLSQKQTATPAVANNMILQRPNKNYPWYTYNFLSSADNAWSLFNGDDELAANFLPSDANACTSIHSSQ